MVKAIPVLNDEFRNALKQMAKFGIISPALIGIAANIFDLHWIIVVALLPVMIWVMIKEYRITKKIRNGMKSGRLVLDKSNIILQDGNGGTIEQTNIFPETTVHFTGYFTGMEYRMPFWKKSQVEKPFNRISIQNPDGTKKEYSFLLETNYMTVQLKNLIQHWRAKGMHIEEMVLAE